MPWNGSGSFARNQDFTADRDAGAPDHFIDADSMDDEMDNLATGIQACLAKNGENVATADLDIGTNKLKNVKLPTLAADAVRLTDLQVGAHYAADTGAADAYAIAPSPAITAYAAGQWFGFIAANASTGASTIDVNGLGTKAIQINGAALAAGDIPANAFIFVMYDGTQFQMLNPKAPALVEDTNPQMGGDLDLNGFNIDFPTTANISDCLDEDNMASNSATALATQQSIKAYADSLVPAADLTTAGIIEVATSAEVNTGTDAGRAVSPDGLAGSNLGIHYVTCTAFDYTTDTATGDGAYYLHIPAGLNGMNLVYVHAEVITAGTTGTTDIQIANVTQAADMLSTKLTIDSGETGSDTAATPAVIDTANDDVSTNDVLRIDVDAVSTTAAAGLIVTLGFQLP